jgi:hypothetical protein
MRHLATRYDIAFGILNNLRRRQRRRLGSDCDRVHDVAHANMCLTHGVVRAARRPISTSKLVLTKVRHVHGARR